MSDRIEAVDMSRYWRLVIAQNRRVSGTWWVMDDGNVESVDVILWTGPDEEPRSWGRICRYRQITAKVKDGKITRLHIDRDREDDANQVRFDLEAVILAAANAVNWEAASGNE